ncbi:MAG: cation transporter [Ignavibacteria bacterium]|nr:cation transporter [Ignavibacteria bacterium]
MKSIFSIITIIILSVFISSCGKKEDPKTTGEDKSAGEQNQQVTASDKSVELQCSGMTCTGCENTIKSKVKKIDGVKEVNADFKSNVVKASYDPGKTNPDAIKEVITSAGYKVESVK